MSFGFIVATTLEVLVGLFIIWGFWHEDKVIAFEDRLLARLGLPRRRRRSAKITQFDSNHSHRERNCI